MPERAGASQTPVPGEISGCCLVLVAPGAASPDQLLQALASRGFCVQVLHDEPSVMAELGRLGGARRVLVVSEPARWARLPDLVQAVHAYHGDVLCWRFDTDSEVGPRLKTMGTVASPSTNGPGDLLDAGAEYAHREGVIGPVGQIIGRRRPLDSLLVKVPGRPLSTRQIVTQQELTMLLGPAPGEAV